MPKTISTWDLSDRRASEVRPGDITVDGVLLGVVRRHRTGLEDTIELAYRTTFSVVSPDTNVPVLAHTQAGLLNAIQESIRVSNGE